MFRSPFYNNGRRGDNSGRNQPMRSAQPYVFTSPEQQRVTNRQTAGIARSSRQSAVFSNDPYTDPVLPALYPEKAIPTVEELQVPEREFNINLVNPSVAQYLKDNAKMGYLKVRVSASQGVTPIPDANITVYLIVDDTRYPFVSETTDVSGLTIPITLPAPDKQLSLDPRNPRPYASYDLQVEHPGYERAEVNNIPIFDGVTSVQNVNMTAISTEGEQTPVPAYGSQASTITMRNLFYY